MTWLMNQIRKETWSPYAAGILLGVVGVLAVLLSNSLLGASGAFESLAGMIGKAVTPGLFSNIYFGIRGPDGKTMVPGVMTAAITWPVILLVGVFFGGMLGALSSGTFKLRFNDDAQWKRIFGPQQWKRWIIGFVGAAILEYAAGIAGGCTSGLVISGGMLLAPAAFIFMVGMFGSGILTTLIVYGRRY
jgi:hypothetical protein